MLTIITRITVINDDINNTSSSRREVVWQSCGSLNINICFLPLYGHPRVKYLTYIHLFIVQ